MRLPALLHWNPSIVVVLILALLISSVDKAHAQKRISSFSENSTLYFNTLEQHFESAQKSKKKDAESFLQNLKIKWQSDFFSDEIKAQIYITSNKMLTNKMSVVPFFKDYFNALIHFLEKNNDHTSLIAWMHAVEYFLDHKSSREFTVFIRSSDLFFSQNIVFSDRTLKWKVDENKYSISFQNDTLKYIFPQTQLSCYTKGDSTNIISTKGEYFPFTNVWEGEGGKITWARANFSEDSVYANLKKYSIPLLYSKFTADSVQFYHHYYFEKPITGKLEEQALASRRGNKAIFPKFISYEKRWKIQNIFPDIDYTGGIIVEGAQLLGFGDESSPASIIIKRNDSAFIKLRSINFNIRPNQIQSAYASVSIHYKSDSIYHSGLRINYSKENQVFSFIRDDFGLTANPFYDTFHQIDMYVEAVYWKMNENIISFDMAKGRTKSPARFESFNYFSEYRYNRLQGIDEKNPLINLKNYAVANRSNYVYFDEYAQHLRMPKEQVQLLLLNLAHQGFLLYDATNERVELGQKINFYLKANAGEIDSDVIRFESRPNQNEANAYLQIDNFDLKINGLDHIILSDSQNLIIEPANRSITMGRNKAFTFDGKITAGRISFATTQSSFNYDEFKLDMPIIDSLWFWVKGDPLPNGGYECKYVQTVISNLTGDLLIDHPNNKSGLEPYDGYPIFTSKKDSYVYYDSKNIQNGVYSKERFYFHVNPFTFSSLNNFSTDEISFEGYLASSGIFPDISQALTVQKDYSLGFTKQLPDNGIMAYGNKGRFYNEINLSNQGLIGNGELTFMNSLTTSNEFLFLPDSTSVYAQTFELEPRISPVEFPRINASNTYQKWLPYEETMEISSTDDNMSMYDEETSLDGTLILQPNSLRGKGNIHFREAQMKSSSFVFKNQTFDADRTVFTDIGMKLNNFSAHADYSKRTVIFTSSDGTASKVDFPDNLYICYMDEAKWHMDEELTEYASNFDGIQDPFGELTLRQLAETEYKGSNFISTHPQQDSLSFFSAVARFNAKDKIIEAEGVHYIRVADAVIFPEYSHITIFRNAEMYPLKNSRIIANAVTKYHEINNAVITIESRKSFYGSGDYVYIDKKQERHPIHFKEIYVDSAYQTFAHGEVLAEENFTLSPEFYFRGNVNLAASRKSLEFDGSFRIATDCSLGQNWIKFNAVIDPENIMLPIAIQPIVPDISRQQKFVGILNSPARKKTYSALLSKKIDYYDSLLLTAHGYIIYDEASKEYRISTKEKLSQMVWSDNYFSLKTTDCSTYGEGKINLDVNFKDLSLESYGNVHLKDSIATFRLGVAIDFHFSSDALKNISDQFAATTVTPVDNSSPYYSKMIAGFMGMDEAEQYISQHLMSNSRRVPDELRHTIFLNDLNLKWNTKLEAYISKGKIGIENLEKNRINALINGSVEVRKSRFGDQLSMYFEINDQWYFFKYYKNVMQVLSSNEVFNEIIRSDMDSKKEKNRLKKEKNAVRRSNYRYILCKNAVKEDFLKRLNSI